MTIAIHAWPYMIKGRLMSGDTPIPGIEVKISDKEGTELGNTTTDRTLTIDGEEPEILVNGMRKSMLFIPSIKPDVIERIEFSSTPDVRFGKRYLNIITRRPEDGGWVMADVAGAVTTPRYFLDGVAEYTPGEERYNVLLHGKLPSRHQGI